VNVSQGTGPHSWPKGRVQNDPRHVHGSFLPFRWNQRPSLGPGHVGTSVFTTQGTPTTSTALFRGTPPPYSRPGRDGPRYRLLIRGDREMHDQRFSRGSARRCAECLASASIRQDAIRGRGEVKEREFRTVRKKLGFHKELSAKSCWNRGSFENKAAFKTRQFRGGYVGSEGFPWKNVV